MLPCMRYLSTIGLGSDCTALECEVPERAEGLVADEVLDAAGVLDRHLGGDAELLKELGEHGVALVDALRAPAALLGELHMAVRIGA